MSVSLFHSLALARCVSLKRGYTSPQQPTTGGVLFVKMHERILTKPFFSFSLSFHVYTRRSKVNSERSLSLSLTLTPIPYTLSFLPKTLHLSLTLTPLHVFDSSEGSS